MDDSFYIGAYWGVRAESVEQCATRTASLLDCLGRRDPLFTRWYQRGESHEHALQEEVASTVDALQALLLEGRSRADATGRLIDELGFLLGLWTGRGDDSASLTIRCGSYAPIPGVNSCVLNLPDEPAVADRLLHVATLVPLIECVVTAWDPDWAVVNSLRFLDLAEPPAGHAPLTGWMVYVSARRGPVPSLPASADMVPIGDRGSLIIVTRDRFAVDNAAHVAAARAVERALGDANLLDPIRS